MNTREFVGDEFYAFCQKQFDDARRYLKTCGRPENDEDRRQIEFHKETARIFGAFLELKPPEAPNPNTTDMLMRQRLIRIETKLSRLLEYFGVKADDREGGDKHAVPALQQRSRRRVE